MTRTDLAPVVGRWRTEGHVLGDDPVPVTGSDVYEPGPGGHVLVHSVDVLVGGTPVRALEIIGEREGDATLARSYDDTGDVTLMRLRIDDDGVWHFTGGGEVARAAQSDPDVPTAAVRSTLRIAPDGRSMTALWERAEDGVTWQPWMDVRFTREDEASSGYPTVMDPESTPSNDLDGPQRTAPPLPDDPRVPRPEDAEPTRSKELGGAAPAVGPESAEQPETD
ncbi:hypothetical protein ACU610_09025 [Geodermatophilus sp. URMC 61]|uniref:hypothetical protein n=1 Tax=Geodermatophilus sp. URMC 61 TaxID=3423411 RepID=UPI00406D478C